MACSRRPAPCGAPGASGAVRSRSSRRWPPSPASASSPTSSETPARRLKRERRFRRPRGAGAESKAEAAKDTTFDWPTYGFNDARTRYVPNGQGQASVRQLVRLELPGRQAARVLADHRRRADLLHGHRRAFLRAQRPRARSLWQDRVGQLNASAPAYGNHRLFGVNLEPGQAFALRPRDGKLLWRTPLPGRSESSPLAFKDDLVIFGCECGTVFALDQRNGSIEWTVETGGAIKGALAQGGKRLRRQLRGRDLRDRRQVRPRQWKNNTTGGCFGRGGGVDSTGGGVRPVTSGASTPASTASTMDTGEIAWSKSTGAEVYSGPVAADTDPGPRQRLHRLGRRQLLRPRRSRPARPAGNRNTGGDVTGAAT